MSGLIVLALLAILCAVLATRVLGWMRITVSTRTRNAIIIIFVIVALASWGQTFRK